MWTVDELFPSFSLYPSLSLSLRRLIVAVDHFVMLQLNAVDPFYFDVSFIYWSFNVDKDVNDDYDWWRWWWCEKMCVVIYIFRIYFLGSACLVDSSFDFPVDTSYIRHVYVIKCGYLSF